MARKWLAKLRGTSVGPLLEWGYWAVVWCSPRRGGRTREMARLQMSGAARVDRRVERIVQRRLKESHTAADTLNFIAVDSWRWHEREGCRRVTERALAALPLEWISEATVRRAENLGVSLPASFAACLTQRSKKREQYQLPEWELEDKYAGYAFADQLAVRRPQLWQRDVSFSAIESRPDIVIKPAQGVYSNGVFLVDEAKGIFDVQASRRVPSWEALGSQVQSHLGSGKVAEDRWLVEELIRGQGSSWVPADDIKCYSFYGRVELVLQVSRYPAVRHRWVDREGRLVETGKYQNDYIGSADRVRAAVKLAEQISSEIPAPFLRIDFLSGQEGLVLGEFTPRPGAYHRFNRDIDRRLGESYLDAEARLFDDLLTGKRFEAFVMLFRAGGATATGTAGQWSAMAPVVREESSLP